MPLVAQGYKCRISPTRLAEHVNIPCSVFDIRRANPRYKKKECLVVIKVSREVDYKVLVYHDGLRLWCGELNSIVRRSYML